MPGTSHKVKSSVLGTKGTAQMWAKLLGSPQWAAVLLEEALGRVRLVARQREVT